LQFARAHPECLDKARWFDWAKQLAGAVKWAHEKTVGQSQRKVGRDLKEVSHV
jgi:hypothetical protein